MPADAPRWRQALKMDFDYYTDKFRKMSGKFDGAEPNEKQAERLAKNKAKYDKAKADLQAATDAITAAFAQYASFGNAIVREEFEALKKCNQDAFAHCHGKLNGRTLRGVPPRLFLVQRDPWPRGGSGEFPRRPLPLARRVRICHRRLAHVPTSPRRRRRYWPGCHAPSG